MSAIYQIASDQFSSHPVKINEYLKEKLIWFPSNLPDVINAVGENTKYVFECFSLQEKSFHLLWVED